MKPSIGRIVIYRSRTGNWSAPAIITATADSLYQPNVDAGHIAGVSSPDHVHLTVFTPGKPGVRGPENADMVIPDSPERPIRPNISGLYQEDDVPFWDPAWLPEAPIFDHLTVQRGWRFSLIDIERDPASTHTGAAGGLTFAVLAETRDAYHDRPRSVMHYFPVPAATYNRAAWQRWILDQLLKIQQHETCEGLVFGDERPFAPTHGPGDDPYVIVQYASDEQRRTSFKGTVKDA